MRCKPRRCNGQPVATDVDEAGVDQAAFQDARRFVPKVALLAAESAPQFRQASRHAVPIQRVNPKDAPRRQYPGDLADDRRRVGYGLEHAKAQCSVERAIGEGKAHGVAGDERDLPGNPGASLEQRRLRVVEADRARRPRSRSQRL